MSIFKALCKTFIHYLVGQSCNVLEGIFLLILVAQQLLNLSATYKTPTNISLKWKLSLRPVYVYNYVVYYESGGGSHSVFFRGEHKKDNSHKLTDLPVGGIHNIFLVALVDLPSPLAGPVSPGMLDQVINNYHHFNCSCRVSRGDGVRRRIRSDWDLIHTDMQSHSTYWSTRSLSQHPVEET